jgi:hypothetical protein
MIRIIFALHNQDQHLCSRLSDFGKTYLLCICVPSSAELCAESGQFSSFVLLYVQQLLRAGMPQRRIPYVLGALVNGLGVRCAQGEGAAVGEGDELGEGVGALWPLEQSRVPHLGRWPKLGLQRLAEST